MNKSIIIYIAIAAFAVIPAITMAQTPSPSSSPVTGGLTSSTGNTSGGLTASANQTTGGLNSSASLVTSGLTSSANQATGGLTSSSNQATGGLTSSSNQSTGGMTSSASPTPKPITPPSNGGGSTGGGSTSNSFGSSSYGSGGGYGYGACSLISTYMRLGANNNSTEVSKLQGFLKNNQGLNVDVNGIFDSKTDVAAKAFQNKYSETILAPWGMTQPSGFVYITTIKKINQLACSKPLTLNASELSEINSYKNGNRSGNANATVVSIQTGNSATASTTGVSGQNNTDENTNVAASVQPSIISRFWNFILSLFR